MPEINEITKLTELIANGGSAFLAALLLVLVYLQRKDIDTARKRVVDLENRVFELSTAYNRTMRKFEQGFAQTRELMSKVVDRL